AAQPPPVTPAGSRADFRPDESPAPEPLRTTDPPAAPVAAAPAAARPRIVAFRVTQGSATAAPNAVDAQQASWRLDAPPAPAGDASGPERPDATVPSGTENSAAPPAQAAKADGPGDAPGNAVVFSSAIRHWLERHRGHNDAASVSGRPAR